MFGVGVLLRRSDLPPTVHRRARPGSSEVCSPVSASKENEAPHGGPSSRPSGRPSALVGSPLSELAQQPLYAECVIVCEESGFCLVSAAAGPGRRMRMLCISLFIP